jgi:hypothetical protein
VIRNSVPDRESLVPMGRDRQDFRDTVDIWLGMKLMLSFDQAVLNRVVIGLHGLARLLGGNPQSMAAVKLVITVANPALPIRKIEEQVGPTVDPRVNDSGANFQGYDESGASTGEFGVALPVAKGNFLHPKVLPFGRWG